MSEKSKSFLASETNCYQDSNIPWLEWKDLDLNNEKWAIPKDGADGLFLDAERIVMPRSLEPYQWIRAKDLKHLTGHLTVYTTAVKYPDLITNNKHLLHSEFMRWFISALRNLEYCGREGLQISGESLNFIWANRHEPWHGWMHVYSLNKAGKGVQHRPVINPNGKYVVRLHCIGCWRRILVDDNIPVDKNGRPLLPRTFNNFELWPMLLAKALLKVASLSWTRRREIVDFHPIACFTGWICLTLNIAHLSPQDKWSLLTKYSEHFEWTPRTARGNVSENSKSVTSDKTRKSLETPRLLIEKSQPITLFFLLRDTRELGNDAVPGLSPCWDHVIYVVQSRDIPLDPKDVKPPLERWKLYRWLNWAVSRGVINPVDYFVPIRYLKIVSPLEERNESVYDKVEAVESSSPASETERLDKSASRTKSQNTKNTFTVTKEDITDDISRWIDFNAMSSYVTEVHLFYKLEYFQRSVQVTDDTVKVINDEDRKVTDVKEIKREKKDIDNSSRQIPKSRNKPLYLFCDSPEEKFFLISLCAAPKRQNDNSCGKDYLILEKYDWFFGPNQVNQSVTISTAGNKSTVVELEAGRQLWRMYCRSESSLLNISSDTTFHIGNQAVVQQLMIAESGRIERMSKLISDSLRKTYQSFGNKDYPIILRNYYRSYMPDSQNDLLKKDKRLRMLIHHLFMKEQVRLIREVFPDKELEEILYSLRVFFLNPNIRLKYFSLRADESNLTIRKHSKRWSRIYNSREEKLNRAAMIIQSFFKMILIKKYKYLHNSDHALHMQVRKELLKISDLFDPSLSRQLLKNITGRNSLRDLYPYSKDFVHVLNIRVLRGVVDNIKYNQWFPIARFVVNPRSSEAIYMAFDLLTDLSRFTLRVFNNQNQREITRIVNNVAPARYEHLPTGYTVFAYGWNEKQRFEEINWEIRVITMKGDEIFYQLNEQWPPSLQIKPPKLTLEELIVTYIPNARNCISRWRLRAISGSVVSMRLATSYNMAEVRVKITDEEGNVLASVDGGSVVLLPLVILEQCAKNKENYKIKDKNSVLKKESGKTIDEKSFYYAEAFVLNDSWPLTDTEWMTVNQIKMRSAESIKTEMQNGNEVSSDLAVVKKDSKQSDSSQTLKSPYCIFQIVTDAKDVVEICQDKRKEQEIALLKKSWWSKDRDRPERGRELREAFLNTYSSKIEPELFLEQKDENSKLIEVDDTTLCLPSARECRTLKSPESYHLPALDLTKYTRKDEIVKNHWTKAEREYENYSDYLNNLIELTNKQFRKYSKLFKRKEEIFWEGRALVDIAYESRKSYVDTLMSERTKNKGKNNNKKKNKS